MIEYIERQDAIKTIRAYFESLPWNGLATTVADDCEKLLNDIPSCDVRETERFESCPNCGVDMRGNYD